MLDQEPFAAAPFFYLPKKRTSTPKSESDFKEDNYGNLHETSETGFQDKPAIKGKKDNSI